MKLIQIVLSFLTTLLVPLLPGEERMNAYYSKLAENQFDLGDEDAASPSSNS